MKNIIYSEPALTPNQKDKLMTAPVQLLTVTLQSTEQPETMQLSGADVNDVEWQDYVTLVATSKEFALFVADNGVRFMVPSTEIYYKLSEKELDAMVKERLQLPHDLGITYDSYQTIH